MDTQSTPQDPAAAPQPAAPIPETYSSASSTRSTSPSPSVSPSRARDALPTLDRSISTPPSSIASSTTSRATSSQTNGPAATGRRRGYLRPQATTFAESARSRESVMSLGSIAHVQHYFARTGLLDGKGAQHLKDKKTRISSAPNALRSEQTDLTSGSVLTVSEADDPVGNLGLGDLHIGDGTGSHLDRLEAADTQWDMGNGDMLPPTVSLYREREISIIHPPNVLAVRRELREVLEDARKVLQEVEAERAKLNKSEGAGFPDDDATASTEQHRSKEVNSQDHGFDEIEGLHILDIFTLAIRAAKNYYTAHGKTHHLTVRDSERHVRSDLYHVLEILKRMASRNFAGGMRDAERKSISAWVESVDAFLNLEEVEETREQQEREAWSWRDGDWSGKERERAHLFLLTFDPDSEPLPQWSDSTACEDLPTPFLKALQSGIRLVRLHNVLVARSARRFEEIKVYHTDTQKPYRCMENLRFWIKAAELRWEIKLAVDVSAVVHGNDRRAWEVFDSEIMRWARHVREEMMSEWSEHKSG